MNILFQHGETSGIWFPPGPQNSCDFTTKKCEKECGLKANKQERYTQNIFEEMSINYIVSRVLVELEDLECNHLYWYPAGDCPKHLTGKVAKVMGYLSQEGKVIQKGFTRNYDLWEHTLKLGKKFRLAYTTESADEAKKLSKFGLVAYPIYDSDHVKLYSGGEGFWLCGGGSTGGCGRGIMSEDGDFGEEADIFPEECPQCFLNERGCWIQ